MINLYKKYYLEENAIEGLLQDAIVIFDTSALLDLYYYSDETRKEIFDKVFVFLKDRLWIPAQVYFEYLKNKSLVSAKPIDSYKNLVSKSNKKKEGGYVDNIVNASNNISKNDIQTIRGQLQTLKENTEKEDKHPFLESSIYTHFEEELTKFEVCVNEFMEQSVEFKKHFSQKVKEQIDHFETADVDEVYNAINNHFKIGNEFSYSEMIEIAKEGAFRYKESIPPGYEDEENKKGLQKYGDLFAWKQILRYVGKNKKNCILVINDVKEDWFEEDKKTPRYELLREFNSETNKSIWLMSMGPFLYRINNLLDSQLADNTIDDVEKVLEDRVLQELQEEELFDIVQESVLKIFKEEIYLVDPESVSLTSKLSWTKLFDVNENAMPVFAKQYPIIL